MDHSILTCHIAQQPCEIITYPSPIYPKSVAYGLTGQKLYIQKPPWNPQPLRPKLHTNPNETIKKLRNMFQKEKAAEGQPIKGQMLRIFSKTTIGGNIYTCYTCNTIHDWIPRLKSLHRTDVVSLLFYLYLLYSIFFESGSEGSSGVSSKDTFWPKFQNTTRGTHTHTHHAPKDTSKHTTLNISYLWRKNTIGSFQWYKDSKNQLWQLKDAKGAFFLFHQSWSWSHHFPPSTSTGGSTALGWEWETTHGYNVESNSPSTWAT